jgi:type I restriction enzyme S subunit
MERYDSYKDSGVEWIGEIPSHWEIKKFKHFIKEIGDGGTPSRSEEDNFGGDINWIVVSDIKEKITSTKETLTEKGFNSSSTKLWDIGDVIISLGGTIGKVGILDVPSTTKQGICGIKPNITTTNRYIFYLLQLNSQLFNDWSVGSTIFEFRPTRLRELHFQTPPFSEQQQIVSFLDTKTSLIDSLIEKTQQKIELLKEKRTSLINEVVTKGLNPNVEMKDSGVEWIGEIPSSWRSGKIKYFTETISKGTTPSTIGKETLDEGPVIYIKVENIKESTVDFPPKCFIDKETDELLSRSKLIENDILVVITGSTTGKVVILPKEFTPSNTNQGISFIRLKNKSNENVRYFWYWLISEKIQNQIKVTYTQSTQPNLSMELMGNFYIPIPNEDEKTKIIEYLDEQTQKIDKTISIEEKRIELLKEYRQSLISEVVTGKRKVV